MNVALALSLSGATVAVGAALCYLASPHQLAIAPPWAPPAWARAVGLALMAVALGPLLLALGKAVAVIVWLVWLMTALSAAPFVGVALARWRAGRVAS